MTTFPLKLNMTKNGKWDLEKSNTKTDLDQAIESLSEIKLTEEERDTLLKSTKDITELE